MAYLRIFSIYPNLWYYHLPYSFRLDKVTPKDLSVILDNLSYLEKELRGWEEREGIPFYSDAGFGEGWSIINRVFKFLSEAKLRTQLLNKERALAYCQIAWSYRDVLDSSLLKMVLEHLNEDSPPTPVELEDMLKAVSIIRTWVEGVTYDLNKKKDPNLEREVEIKVANLLEMLLGDDVTKTDLLLTYGRTLLSYPRGFRGLDIAEIVVKGHQDVSAEELVEVIQDISRMDERIKIGDDVRYRLIRRMDELLDCILSKQERGKTDMNEILRYVEAMVKHQDLLLRPNSNTTLIRLARTVRNPNDFDRMLDRLSLLSEHLKDLSLLDNLSRGLLARILHNAENDKVIELFTDLIRTCGYAGLPDGWVLHLDDEDWDLLLTERDSFKLAEFATKLIKTRILPKKVVLTALANGRITITDLLKMYNRTVPFNPNDEIDLVVEYSKFIAKIVKYSSYDRQTLDMSYNEFKGLINRKTIFGVVTLNVPEYELDVLAYEVLTIRHRVIEPVLNQNRKILIVGNTTTGLFYSLPLKTYYAGREDVKVTVSRISSSELHGKPYVLKEGLFDKEQLSRIIREERTVIVLDATPNPRMPDAFKGYRAYFAAMNYVILKLRNGLEYGDPAAVKRVAGLTHLPEDVATEIAEELHGSALEKVLYGWLFKLPRDRLRLYRVYEYDSDRSGVYRIKRKFVHDYSETMEVQNELPEEDEPNIPVILVQCSMSDERIPKVLKKLVPQGERHKKGYFDDKDNLRQVTVYFDDAGVHVGFDRIVEETVKRMVRMENVGQENRE